MNDDFDARLQEIVTRYERVTAEMSEPSVTSDPRAAAFAGQGVRRARGDRRPYRLYLEAVRQAEDATELAAAEDEPEMVSFLEEEAAQARERADGRPRPLEGSSCRAIPTTART